MKKKINQMLMLIATLAIVVTMLLITGVYYNLFRKQVMEDLRTCTVLLQACNSVEEMEKSGQGLLQDGMRLTLVDAGGQVIYDNQADELNMENHSERPEIMAALSQGIGQDVRRSATLSKDTFYYAMRLDSGEVVRVAKQADSIYSIFVSALPILVTISILIIVLCMVVSHFLTKKLIVPVERLAEKIDEYEETSDYEELTPFIKMIREQHQDIIKNAKMRQEFTANVSHELKTPLTSISGYAELIESGMASESDVTRFAHGIRSSANRLLVLINDIIRLSELDGSEEIVAFEKLNLYEMARTCVEMLTMNAEKHNVSISFSGEECFVYGDKQMIEEILYNLCDNAIRYNNVNGKVQVETYNRDGVVTLVISDTGIGIPKEHQERIFERFYRVDKSRSKSTGGTGLGLAIVKHIIARHDAVMELYSEVGEGTTITIQFGNNKRK